MSLLESLASLLSDMGFAQLSLAFVVVGAYALAINGSFSGALRSGAGSVAFVAGAAFAAVTPAWVSGIVFLALVVVSVAAFAAAAWVVSALLGLGAETGPVSIDTEVADVRAPALQPARTLAPVTAIGPF
jgi:hypothetical protein